MSLHIGQRVVCVDDWFRPRGVLPGTILPRRGVVYTIRDIFDFEAWVAVRLEEIVNPPRHYRNDVTGEMVEAAFPAGRFRPVTERTTDISIFTEMLNNSKVKA